MKRFNILAIGIGDYDYLSEGSCYDELDLRLPSGLRKLKQLTTPLVSVRDFVSHWLELSRNGIVEIESIRVLYSKRKLSFPELDDVEDCGPPTLMNVKEAFDSWFNQGDHQDSTSVFFFSGHGIRKNRRILLLQDFYSSRLRPFENCVDLDLMVEGCRRSNAAISAFFIDACQTISSESLKTLNDLEATPLISANQITSGGSSIRIYSSRPGCQAFGKTNESSYFVKALLGAMKKPSLQRGGLADITLSGLLDQMIHAEVVSQKDQWISPFGEASIEGRGEEVLYSLPIQFNDSVNISRTELKNFDDLNLLTLLNIEGDKDSILSLYWDKGQWNLNAKPFFYTYGPSTERRGTISLGKVETQSIYQPTGDYFPRYTLKHSDSEIEIEGSDYPVTRYNIKLPQK